jgi:hypothetical protein
MRKKEGEGGILRLSQRGDGERAKVFPRIASSFKRSVCVSFCVVLVCVCVYLCFKISSSISRRPRDPKKEEQSFLHITLPL